LIYIDANLFVYAAVSRNEIGEKARKIIVEIQQGNIGAASSALTFDELIWAVGKLNGRPAGLVAGEIFLNMPGLIIADVNSVILGSALGLMKKYQLNPRDSVHAATAIHVKADYILSQDRDFDRLGQIRRKDI